MWRGLLLVILALGAGYAGSLLGPKTGDTRTEETLFERISRTRELNCGYYYRTGYFEKDKQTGQYHGLMYDVTEAIGRAADLKINWKYEIGIGDVPEALRIGKVDAFCSAFGENAKRAWHTIIPEPPVYVLMNAYVKHGDTRFDYKTELMNDPNIKFYVVDGENTQFMTSAEFPKATQVAMPQMVEHADMLLGIAGGKADALLSDRAQAFRFAKHNPGKIQEVKVHKPVRSFPLGIGVHNSQPELANLIAAATRELILSGELEKIIRKNEEYPGTYGRNMLEYKQ